MNTLLFLLLLYPLIDDCIGDLHLVHTKVPFTLYYYPTTECPNGFGNFSTQDRPQWLCCANTSSCVHSSSPSSIISIIGPQVSARDRINYYGDGLCTDTVDVSYSQVFKIFVRGGLPSSCTSGSIQINALYCKDFLIDRKDTSVSSKCNTVIDVSYSDGFFIDFRSPHATTTIDKADCSSTTLSSLFSDNFRIDYVGHCLDCTSKPAIVVDFSNNFTINYQGGVDCKADIQTVLTRKVSATYASNFLLSYRDNQQNLWQSGKVVSVDHSENFTLRFIITPTESGSLHMPSNNVVKFSCPTASSVRHPPQITASYAKFYDLYVNSSDFPTIRSQYSQDFAITFLSPRATTNCNRVTSHNFTGDYGLDCPSQPAIEVEYADNFTINYQAGVNCNGNVQAVLPPRIYADYATNFLIVYKDNNQSLCQGKEVVAANYAEHFTVDLSITQTETVSIPSNDVVKYSCASCSWLGKSCQYPPQITAQYAEFYDLNVKGVCPSDKVATVVPGCVLQSGSILPFGTGFSLWQVGVPFTLHYYPSAACPNGFSAISARDRPQWICCAKTEVCVHYSGSPSVDFTRVLVGRQVSSRDRINYYGDGLCTDTINLSSAEFFSMFIEGGLPSNCTTGSLQIFCWNCESFLIDRRDTSVPSKCNIQIDVSRSKNFSVFYSSSALCNSNDFPTIKSDYSEDFSITFHSPHPTITTDDQNCSSTTLSSRYSNNFKIEYVGHCLGCRSEPAVGVDYSDNFTINYQAGVECKTNLQNAIARKISANYASDFVITYKDNQQSLCQDNDVISANFSEHFTVIFLITPNGNVSMLSSNVAKYSCASWRTCKPPQLITAAFAKYYDLYLQGVCPNDKSVRRSASESGTADPATLLISILLSKTLSVL